MSVDFASPDIKHLATEMPISPKGNCKKGLLQTLNINFPSCVYSDVFFGKQ